MEIVNVLQTPPVFFRLFLKLALYLFHSAVTINYRSRKVVPERPALPPLSSFDVNTATGFFPKQPLPHLPTGYSIWEDALREANNNLILGDRADEDEAKCKFGEQWRDMINAWPVLDTTPLHNDLRACQRAHMVLAWLVNFYVHSIPSVTVEDDVPALPTVVPKTLAVPLVEISRHLGFAPVLTFADTVLWNWEFVNPDLPLTADNMRFVNLFSGTEDERNFYEASARAELRGVELLRIIDDYASLPTNADLTSLSKVARDLNRLSGIVDDISGIIRSIRPNCDPHVFYFDIRPWFEGSDAKGPSHPGWVYEGVDQSENLDLSGPSAGQSSIIHALDIFLDVDHKLRQRRYPAPSSENKRADHGFMERMRRYMPGKHQEYLKSISTLPRSVRDVARTTPALREPYDAAVTALKKLRDSHIRIACLYVVSMSRSSPNGRSGCPAAAMMDRLEAAHASGKGPVRGTGGNELSLLLKAGRDATLRAILKAN